MNALTAPFPWFGGKRRWADEINRRLGTVDVYIEPFAGSLAVLLRRAPARKEIVCDLDDGIVNFWRAVQAAPERVAEYASHPTFHTDLTARHRYLIQWAREHGPRLAEDPRYFDAEAAGWWVWGVSNWIGAGWCTAHVQHPPGGRGVALRRPGPGPDKITNVSPGPGGEGVQAQRADEPNLTSWFAALQERLRRVIVLRRPWSSALSPTMTGWTRTGARGSVGILLDPPYLQTARAKTLYGSDAAAESDRAAIESYEWAVAHGRRFRIAYCCHARDFPVPKGWTSAAQTFAGIRGGERHQQRRDCVMFSPACEGS